MSYEECSASLLRVMRVYYECKEVHLGLQRVSENFEHVQNSGTARDFEESRGML